MPPVPQKDNSSSDFQTTKKKLVSSATDFERETNPQPFGEEPMSEKEILDIAEEVFVKISEVMKEKGVGVRDVYEQKAKVLKSDGEEYEIISPDDFIDTFKQLELTDLEETEIECLLRVLLKPEIENPKEGDAPAEVAGNILLSDLVMILENFGVEEFSDSKR